MDMEDPKFPDVQQIWKKGNYRVTKMREKSDKQKLQVRMQKLELRMKKKHASGTGGGPGLSPIHDPDGDDMDMDNDLETENIVADPYKESPLVLRKIMTVDPPGHQPINILKKSIDSFQLFTTEEILWRRGPIL